MTMHLTGLVITIAVIALGIYDLVCVVRSGATSSISQFLVRIGFRSPIIVFALGFVCGHLFGYMKLETADPIRFGISREQKCEPGYTQVELTYSDGVRTRCWNLGDRD